VSAEDVVAETWKFDDLREKIAAAIHSTYCRTPEWCSPGNPEDLTAADAVLLVVNDHVRLIECQACHNTLASGWSTVTIPGEGRVYVHRRCAQ
jgi:hypothetical protein